MGTITYPKKGVSSVGEQTSKTFLDETAKEGYNQKGSSREYNGSMSMPKSRNDSRVTGSTPFVSGGGSHLVSASYPRSLHGALPSEGARNVIKPLPGDKPKEA